MPGAGWWRKHLTAQSVYEKFILNEGDVQIEKEKKPSIGSRNNETI